MTPAPNAATHCNINVNTFGANYPEEIITINAKPTTRSVASQINTFLDKYRNYYCDEVLPFQIKGQWYARVRGNKRFIPTIQESPEGRIAHNTYRARA